MNTDQDGRACNTGLKLPGTAILPSSHSWFSLSSPPIPCPCHLLLPLPFPRLLILFRPLERRKPGWWHFDPGFTENDLLAPSCLAHHTVLECHSQALIIKGLAPQRKAKAVGQNQIGSANQKPGFQILHEQHSSALRTQPNQHACISSEYWCYWSTSRPGVQVDEDIRQWRNSSFSAEWRHLSKKTIH